MRLAALLALATFWIGNSANPATTVRRAAQLAPAPRQLAWQREELTAFIHFGPNTYTGREIGTGTESPSLVDPADLDTDQWARTLKNAGFRKVILVTKHHDGLVLWPSRYTNHSIAHSIWRGGHGDVVRAFVDSAHRYGLAVGFYLSPADLHEALPGGRYADASAARAATIPTLQNGDPRRPKRLFHFRLDDYNRYYMNTLYELLTQYGPVEEVWFDGFNPLKNRAQPYAFAAWYALVRALQPNAVMFAGPDLDWVGNEDGVARTTQWSVVAFTGAPVPNQTTALHDPGAPNLGGRNDLTDPRTRLLAWYPSECDARLEAGWFWHPHHPPKSLARLQSMYYTSVGRNCQLLLDVPPDASGRFDAADVGRVDEFGAWVHREFGHDLAARARSTRAQTGGMHTLAIALPTPVRFQTICLQERIEAGQRVERFAVEVRRGNAWRQIASGTTIGYKRLLRLAGPVTAQRLRVNVLQSRDTSQIARFSLYP